MVFDPNTIQSLNQMQKIFQGGFTGDVYPAKKKRTNYAKVALQEHHILNPSGNHFNAIKVKVYEPDINYPFPSVFLYFEGGGKSWYCRLSIIEYRAFVAKLGDWERDLNAATLDLEAKALYWEQQRAQQEQWQQIAQMNQPAGYSGNGDADNFADTESDD